MNFVFYRFVVFVSSHYCNRNILDKAWVVTVLFLKKIVTPHVQKYNHLIIR
jgi:hypothetical protein